MQKLAPAIVIAALLASASSLAQQPRPQPEMPMAGQGGMMHGQGQGQGAMMCPMMGHGMMGHGMMGQGMEAHMDGHVAFLKAELKITPAQEQAWKPFEEALRTSAASMGPARMAMTDAKTMDDVFEQRQRMLTSRLENSRRLQTAWTKLAPTLTAEQQERARKLLGPHLKMMM